jgi:orotate phosphoribosyltransferase
VGSAVLEPGRRGAFLPGVVELVAIPLLVNVASAALCALVSRLVASRAPADGEGELEVLEVSVSDGERVIVVRRTRRRLR